MPLGGLNGCNVLIALVGRTIGIHILLLLPSVRSFFPSLLPFVPFVSRFSTTLLTELAAYIYQESTVLYHMQRSQIIERSTVSQDDNIPYLMWKMREKLRIHNHGNGNLEGQRL